MKDERQKKPQTPEGPRGWLTAEHAAPHLDFPNTRAFYEWVKRHGVPCARRGKRLLFWPADLDRVIGGAHLKRGRS